METRKLNEVQVEGAFDYPLNIGDNVIFVKAGYRGGIKKIAHGEIVDIDKCSIAIKDMATGKINHCFCKHVISIKGIKENM